MSNIKCAVRERVKRGSALFLLWCVYLYTYAVQASQPEVGFFLHRNVFCLLSKARLAVIIVILPVNLFILHMVIAAWPCAWLFNNLEMVPLMASCYFFINTVRWDQGVRRLSRSRSLKKTVFACFLIYTGVKVNVTIANWHIFRPQNSKQALQKCLRQRKYSGLESGLILKLRPNIIVM
jgi:hypothetical protein